MLTRIIYVLINCTGIIIMKENIGIDTVSLDGSAFTFQIKEG